MKDEKPLSAFYRAYKDGNMSKKELESRMFLYLCESQNRYRLFEGNRDRWDDFLSWLYSRLSRAADLYRDVGSSFDAYITGLLHNAAREYRTREADRRLTENACWQARAEEMALFESGPEYFQDHSLEKEKAEYPILECLNPKQLLFLLLKSYHSATCEMVAEVAARNGMEISELRKIIDILKERCFEKDAETRALEDRLMLQHHRCLAYQKKAGSAQGGTDYREKLDSRFERAKKRFLAMKKRLEGKRKAASNRMIAEVLGIPQGTVDSGIAAIKKRLERMGFTV